MVLDLIPFWVSFQLGLWVTALLILIAFPLAWLFSQARGSWVPWVESLFTLPMVVSPTVLGFYILITISPQGPIGGFFENVFGLRLAFSFTGMVIASCVAGLPYMLSALKTGILAVDPRLLEASYTLGKGVFETIFRVLLPNMRGALFTGIVLTFARTVGEFGVVLMIGGSIPGVTKVVSIAIYEKVESLDFASAHVYALILIVLAYGAVVSLQFLQRKERRRVGL